MTDVTDLGSAAGATDRGLVHRTNEDGYALRIVHGALPAEAPFAADDPDADGDFALPSDTTLPPTTPQPATPPPTTTPPTPPPPRPTGQLPTSQLPGITSPPAAPPAGFDDVSPEAATLPGDLLLPAVRPRSEVPPGPGGATLAVVCDGVSTAPGSGPAAVRAATAAVTLLAQIALTLAASAAEADSPSGAPSSAAATSTSPPGAAGPAFPGGSYPASAHPDSWSGGGPSPDGSLGDNRSADSRPGRPVEAGGIGVGVGGNITSVSEDTRPLGPRRRSASRGGVPAVPWQPSALRAAAAHAHHAALDHVVEGDSPACTFVAAIVTPGRLSVGWLGDSRAYLIDQAGARVVTEDDTLAAAAVRAGLLPPDQAETGPGAHTITQWLGTGSSSTVPQVGATDLAGPGRVVLCSDGLWNYISAAEDLAARIGELPADAAPHAVARHLVAVANAAGGGDNITVIVIDIPAT